MGVAGSGKTTVGRLLAATLDWRFYDADDFHSPASVERIRAGIPLTDADRAPWLDALAELLRGLARDGTPAVLACSALRQAYRDRLAAAGDRVRFVYLRGEPGVLRQRLERRLGHFAGASILASQFATLEEPAGAVTVDATLPAPTIVALVRQELGV